MRHPVPVSGNRHDVLRLIASQQRGRVSRDQLSTAGFSSSAIGRLVANGQLHREHRAVYVLGHTAPAPLTAETAALLACGEHAVLSHYTAALMHKLIPHGDGNIHVTIRGRHGPNPEGVHVHRTSRLNRKEVEIVDRLPLTSPARTIFDLAAIGDTATVERAVEEALVQRLVTDGDLRGLVRSAVHGTALVTAVLDAHTEPGITKSKAERRYRALIRAAQLPQPKTNFPFRGYSLDCYWPELGVVVEVQGYKFHSTRRKFERDTRKAATLAAAGLSVSYVTWLQMDNEPYAVVARTAQALALAQARQQAA